MTDIPKHAPIPWSYVASGCELILDSKGKLVAEIHEDGPFIVRAVNNHQSLLDACRAALFNDGGYGEWKNQVREAIRKASE